MRSRRPERLQEFLELVAVRPSIPKEWKIGVIARTMLLVGDATKNQADSLLAPIGVYAPGDRLKLKTASQAFLIRVNRVIQRGEDWERTGFQVLEKLVTRLG